MVYMKHLRNLIMKQMNNYVDQIFWNQVQRQSPVSSVKMMASVPYSVPMWVIHVLSYVEMVEQLD